ncbi:hypothetical protein TIFTF001_009891 [Ficus carica]|uniref:BED-type domain-containing protein n=1 Tax=Ficus carica TaxID=3494 RepID=A0AA88AHY5_FICCA|nr:hypothetical protein TIFTF001_009891 [Ficus carica]
MSSLSSPLRPACLCPRLTAHPCGLPASALGSPLSPLAVYHLKKQICLLDWRTAGLCSAESALSPPARSTCLLGALPASALPSPPSPLRPDLFCNFLGWSFLLFLFFLFSSSSCNGVMDRVDLESQSENIDLEKASNVDIDLDEDVIELEGSDPNQPSKKKRLKSKVWEFFDVLPLGSDKKLKSACKKCGQ